MSNTDVPVEATISLTKNGTSAENISKIMQIKERLSIKLDNIENDISKIEELKQTSIEELENKKIELRELLNPDDINKEHSEALKELEITETEIEARKFSITKLDETIANLDLEIARIQSEHDKAVEQLKEKWRKLNEQLEYYEKLNEKIEELAKMIKEQGEQFDEKLKELSHKRSELLKRTDLSETTLNRMLREIDDQIGALKRDHDTIINAANESLLDYTADQGIPEDEDQFLTAVQIKEIETFETDLRKSKQHRLSKEERLSLLKRGFQITPSARIITQDDRALTLEQLRYLGYLSYDYSGEEEEQQERWIGEIWGEEHEEEKQEVFVPEKEIIYSVSSVSSSTTTQLSSKESGLSSQDTEYLKQIFGKSLSLALAEITAVQPADPIHYLAHWLFKYRYNQEIDEVKKKEVEALIEERKRIAAEKWHLELEQEARLAMQEILFRVENCILQKEYALMRLNEEIEGENEAEIPYPSELALID